MVKFHSNQDEKIVNVIVHYLFASIKYDLKKYHGNLISETIKRKKYEITARFDPRINRLDKTRVFNFVKVQGHFRNNSFGPECLSF